MMATTAGRQARRSPSPDARTGAPGRDGGRPASVRAIPDITARPIQPRDADMKQLLVTLTACAAACFPGGQALAQDARPNAAARRPNVLVILSDDQGWGDLSVHGNTQVHTPNIDGLARDGALFDRFYVCPVCSPTRAEFLTGRYHPRSGVHSTSTGGERFDLDESTIAQAFQAAGYATGAF